MNTRQGKWHSFKKDFFINREIAHYSLHGAVNGSEGLDLTRSPAIHLSQPQNLLLKDLFRHPTSISLTYIKTTSTTYLHYLPPLPTSTTHLGHLTPPSTSTTCLHHSLTHTYSFSIYPLHNPKLRDLQYRSRDKKTSQPQEVTTSHSTVTHLMSGPPCVCHTLLSLIVRAIYTIYLHHTLPLLLSHYIWLPTTFTPM